MEDLENPKNCKGKVRLSKLSRKRTKTNEPDNNVDDPEVHQNSKRIVKNHLLTPITPPNIIDNSNLNQKCGSKIYYLNKNDFLSVIKPEVNKIPLCSLPNIGSTCFFNAIIQLLRFTPGFLICLHQMTFVNSLWKKGEIPLILKQLHSLFMNMKRLDNGEDSEDISISTIIKNILNLFVDDCTHYKLGQQFDAHEFLSWILKIMLGIPDFKPDGKKSTINWGKRKTNREDVTDFKAQFLNGLITTELTCCECESSKTKTEEYWDLEFKVKDTEENGSTAFSNYSLLDLVCQDSILRDGNKYWCDLCLHHVEAKLKVKIEHFPSVLIFHPNQSCSNNSMYTKNLNSLPIQETMSCSNSDCIQPCNLHIYQIYAAVIHIGTSIRTGHYVALININRTLFKKHQELLLMEDNVVTQPLTRQRKEKVINGFLPKNCCWPNWLTEEDKERWILFDDDNIETCKYDNIKQILSEELGTIATPSVLLYFRH